MGQDFCKKILKFLGFLLGCSILIVLLGFVMSFLWDVSRWELDYKANIADILNVFVTVILAFIVSWFLAKKQSVEKFEKELLINDLKDMETKAKGIINLYECNESESVSLDEVSLRLNTLLTSVRNFKQTCLLYYNEFSYSQLEDTSVAMYKSMTDMDGRSMNLHDVDLAGFQSLYDNFIRQTRICMRQISRL